MSLASAEELQFKFDDFEEAPSLITEETIKVVKPRPSRGGKRTRTVRVIYL